MSNDAQTAGITRRDFAVQGFALGAMVALTGCGGGHAKSSRIRIGIDWGESDSRAHSRYIPPYANSIAIEAYPVNKPSERTQAIVNRPSGAGGRFTTVVLPGVYHPGTYFVALSARTGENGLGESVATGGGQVELIAGVTSDMSVTLASVIKSLVVYGIDVQIAIGSSAQLLGSAMDPDGKIVLVPANYLQWKQISGLDVISMSSNGQISALKPGSATVELKEPGVGISATAIIKVVNRSTIDTWSQQYGGFDFTNVAHRIIPTNFLQAPRVSTHGLSVGQVNHVIAVSTDRAVVSGDAGFACIDVTNFRLVWEVHTGSEIRGCPALSDNGRLVVPCMNGNILIVDPETGSMIKTLQTQSPVTGSVSILDSLAVVGNANGDVYCIDLLTSTIKWNTPNRWTVPNPIYQPPLVTAAGVVVVSNMPVADGYSLKSGALDEEIFTFRQGFTTAVVFARTSIMQSSKYWIIDSSGRLYCIGPTGNSVFEKDLGTTCFTPSFVAPSTTGYVDSLSRNGFLIAPLMDGGIAAITEDNVRQHPAEWLGLIPTGSATVIGKNNRNPIAVAIICGRQFVPGREEVIGVSMQYGIDNVVWRLSVPYANGQAVPCGDKLVVPAGNGIAILG